MNTIKAPTLPHHTKPVTSIMPIQLLAPGLLDPWPDANLQHSFPLLEKLLARAKQRPAPNDYPHTLFSLLDMPCKQQGDLPTAKLCWLADIGQTTATHLVHADPIYLKADINNVQLFRPGNLNAEQAAAFAQNFNDLYAEDDIQLHTPVADRWYISMPQPLQTPGATLDQVTGRNLRSFISAKHQSKEWASLFTEIQMLFHQLTVNQIRQANGDLPVSGLWLSGAGDPPPVGKHNIQLVQGNEPLLYGIAKYAGLSHSDGIPTEDTNTLVVKPDCQVACLTTDYSAWIDAVRQLEQSLHKWIQNGNQIILYPCNGRCRHWTTNSKYRLWRKKYSLANYFKHQHHEELERIRLDCVRNEPQSNRLLDEPGD